MAEVKPPVGKRIATLEEKHINGYFAHIGPSRSGHNFVKKNLLSYIGDPKSETRKYLNLENYNPAHFNIQYENVEFENYPNSIYILTVRSLMNWYSSMMHFITRSRAIDGNNVVHKPSEKRVNAIREFAERQFVDQATVDANPEMLKDPNIVIVPPGFEPNTVNRDGEIIKTIDDFINDFAERLLGKWLAIAKEFKGVTNHVPGFIKIYYDQFFTDETYRRNICSQLNGVYNEDELNVVARAGGGSSFDRITYDGNAAEMKVLERYKQWEINGLGVSNPFLNFIKTHEALAFYQNNFDISPEEQTFIDNL